MTPTTASSPPQPPPPGTRVQRILLAWALPVLMVALVTLSGSVISLAWDGQSPWRFALVAFLGGLTSALLARSKVQDGIAILMGMAVGIAVVWSTTAAFAGHLDGSWWQRILRLHQPVVDALVRDDLSGINRDLTAEVLMTFTVWISSWIAVWVLLRVGYVALALIPPAVIILANEHFTGQGPAWPVILMVALCILIVAAHHIRTEGSRWRGQHLSVADSVAGKFLVSGLAIAVAVSSTLLISPSAWSETVFQPLIATSIQRFEAMRTEAELWFDDVLGTRTAEPADARYTEFSDGFSVGGPLTLSDQPEVLVEVDRDSAPYLTARSYDHYTGRGWVSSSARAFGDDDQSVRRSPELLYNPNWEVSLSNDARNERSVSSATVTMLGPATDMVLSVDSFLAANVQTVVRMGWTQVRNLSFVLAPNTLNTLPPDVQLLASLLLQSELSGDQSEWGPGAVSIDMQAAIEAEVRDLGLRGIEATWTSSPEGIVQTLSISGRLPVFDDVEAVFRRRGDASTTGSYTVRGLTSTSTAQQLTIAGDEYPDWVANKYLQTDTTVTERTLELTNEIVGGEENPYQQAMLLEEWLRTNIVYDENVEAPPGQQDLVDYVLFDNRRGYCEHYAAAMAVMLRSLGVPARVVVGYAPGQYDPGTGSWLYLQSNAHAWVEAYFPGYGWIPFEPTASQPLGQFDAGDVTEATGEAVAEPTPEPLVPTADVATPDLDADNSVATPQPTSSDDAAAAPMVVPPTDGTRSDWVVPVTLGVVVTTVLGGVVWLSWHRGLRGTSPASGLMRRVQRVGGWVGIQTRPTTTPRECAAQFDGNVAPLAGPVKRITRAYEIEAYGRKMAPNELLDDATRAWREIRSKAWRLLRYRWR